MTIAKKIISFVSLSIIIQSAAFATPKINGVQTLDQGDTETYTISGVSGASSVIWAVDGGTITTNNVTNIVVNWTVAGNKNISASVVVNLSLYDLDLDVVVNSTVPDTPPTPTKGTTTCGSTPLHRVGSIPSGETWYWQTSSTGTSTASAGNTYNVTSDGTYYLRAKNAIGWSTATSGVYVNVNETGLGGTISGNESGYGSLSGTLTLSGSHGTRVWQKKVGNGAWTNMGSSGTSISYNITQTTKYRVKVTNGVCSPVYSSEKSNTVYPVPVVTSTENGTIGFGGAALSITGTSSSPQWLRNGSDISGATQTTLNIFEPGSYQVRVTTGGKTTTSDALILTNPIKSQNINYTRTINILEPDVFLDADLANVEDKNLSQSVNYYDGLGRPTQNVQIRTSAGGYDIVQHMAYDAYGRQPKSYLPYSGNNTGAFQDEAEVEQNSFYDSNFPASTNTGDYAFSETEYESSSLNRVLKSYAPGQPWANNVDENGDPTSGGNKPVSFSYQSNVATDQVMLWEINNERLIAYRFYEPGALYKTVTTDENTGSNEGEVIEYKDKQGRVVLKQVKEGTDDYLETYYVYDDFGNLRYVLPPMASSSYQNTDLETPDGYTLLTESQDLLPTSDGKYAYIPTVKIKIKPTKTLSTGFECIRHGIAPNQDFLDTWAFQYKYDERQRMVEKRVPGADWVYMVYDARDRLVLTQDGNQRSTTYGGSGKAWSFTKYDVLNRPVITGVMNYASTKTRAQMQAIVNDFYVASTGNTDQWYEESSLENDAIHGFTDQSFPKGLLESDCYTVTYYDNYTHTKYKVSDFSVPTAAAFNDDDTKLIPTLFEHVKGQVMGTKIKIGDADEYIETTNFYDDRYRLIQSRVTNQKGGTDVFTTQYDFASRVRKTYLQHSNPEINSTAIAQEYTYDHAGRLKTISHEIEGTNEKIIIVSNTYNELGELESKQLADDYEQVHYSYNIRGWLTKINDLTDATTKKFEMDLKYDVAGQYNGNIGAIDWKNPYEAGVTNSYDYSYDRVNRLTGAAFSNGSTMDFDVPSLSYDGNGNILTLQREGNHDDKAAQLFDHLDYDYNGNQLMRVTDNATQSKDGGFKDGNTTGDDYAYDANGNMIVDKNKGITNIEYNHLNLPKVVTMSTGTITYTYDAAGTKLSQQVAKSGEDTKVTDYMGGFIYEKSGTGTSELQFAQHDEGRIVRKGTDWEYQYHLKDHLGNVRTTFKTETESDVYLATLEDGNPHENLFERHDEVTRIKHDLFDHTDAGSVSTHSILLDGSANRKIGLAKSLWVKPGDVIDLEVYVKYFDSNAGGMAAILNTLAANLASGASGIVVEGVNAGASSLPFADFFSGDKTSSSAPEAYLNYFVFDQNFDLVSSQSGFKQVSTSARETGSDVDHQELSHSITIAQAGFVYIYLSNDDTEPFDVFFDDFKVTQHHTDIVSKDDYYPFGLTFNGYNDTDPFYTGTASGAGLKWKDLGFRNFDLALGRFHSLDPLAELQLDQSLYHYAGNNPIRNIDILGLTKGNREDKKQDKRKKKDEKARNKLLQLTKKGKVKKSNNRVKTKSKKSKTTSDDEDSGDEDSESDNSEESEDDEWSDSSYDKMLQNLERDGESEFGSPEIKTPTVAGLQSQAVGISGNNSQLEKASTVTGSKNSVPYWHQRKPVKGTNQQWEDYRQDLFKNLTPVQANALYKLGQLSRTSTESTQLQTQIDVQSSQVNSDVVPERTEEEKLQDGAEAIISAISNASNEEEEFVDITKIVVDEFGKEWANGDIGSNKYEGIVNINGDEINLSIENKASIFDQDDDGDKYLIDLSNIEVTEDDSEITYTFKHKDHGGTLIVITVSQDDKDTFEESTGIYSAEIELDELMDSNITFTPTQFNEARELIDELPDDKQGEKYRALRGEMKYVNQMGLDSEAKPLEATLRTYDRLRTVMCQFATISRELEYQGVENPDPSKHFADALEDIRQDNYPLPVAGDDGYVLPENLNNDQRKEFFAALKAEDNMRTRHGLWILLLEDQFDVTIENIATNMLATEANFNSIIGPYLDQGYGIITTIGSHVVSIQDVTAEGLIVDDPNGTLETDLINENYIYDRNQCGDVYVANGLRNTESDTDRGADNLWTWDRLGDVVLEYVKVISKPE